MRLPPLLPRPPRPLRSDPALPPAGSPHPQHKARPSGSQGPVGTLGAPSTASRGSPRFYGARSRLCPRPHPQLTLRGPCSPAGFHTLHMPVETTVLRSGPATTAPSARSFTRWRGWKSQSLSPFCLRSAYQRVAQIFSLRSPKALCSPPPPARSVFFSPSLHLGFVNSYTSGKAPRGHSSFCDAILLARWHHLLSPLDLRTLWGDLLSPSEP